MGRHSAPDDAGDSDAAVPAAVAAPSRPSPRPRHASPDEAPAPAAPPRPLALVPPSVEPVAEAPPAEPAVEADPEEFTLEEAPTEEAPTEEAPTEEAPTEEAAEPSSVGAAEARTREPRATSADLALLRHRGDIRARVIAAIVVPFILYTAVMLLIGRMDVYLIWIWIPLVTAGVVGGSILDSAHRRPPPE